MRDFVAQLFHAAGLSSGAAARVAAALVEADMSGRASHGVLQAENYLVRLIAGAMSVAEAPVPVSDNGGAIVLDAAHMQGHLAAEAAIGLAIERARDKGVAVVAVRRGFHFGVAGRYVRMAAEAGCVGLAMCNTKPVMPAPGGAERLVGTNPLAIGLPQADAAPIVLDMATTAGTVGRMRQALAAGKPVPADWALDTEGRPTTDAATAMAGLLLPAGGAKGFGLSFMIDLMAGLLSGGAWGDGLGQMTDDATQPYNSSYLFIVLDIAHFRPLAGFQDEARAAAARVRASRRAPGVDRLFTPGEQSAEALGTNTGTIPLAEPVVRTLVARAGHLGVPVPDCLTG
jgi:LDH2 family malate/lactate/ureidoglycolate dehydrogenase